MESPLARHPRPARRKAATVSLIEPDTYLTDESSLFRCLSIERSEDPYTTMMMLEDCLTLEVIILPMDEVAWAGLRIVR